MTDKQLKTIFNKTNGHCHFCGDVLGFHKYGCKDMEDLQGAWEADHIIQKGKGGPKSAENCLPACVFCNRLRWHRKGRDIRELLLLGIIAKNQIKKRTATGVMLSSLKKKRIERNSRRRSKRKTLG